LATNGFFKSFVVEICQTIEKNCQTLDPLLIDLRVLNEKERLLILGDS